jgi:hypothetical protein
MPSPSDCLAGLVGLSASGILPCFPLPAGEGVNNDYITASTTGLYLERVEGLQFQAKPGTAAAPDFYSRLDRARANAIDVVYTNLSTRLGSTVGSPLHTMSGTLGGPPKNGTLGAANTAKMILPTTHRDGGAWRITGLQLYTDIAVTAPVLLDGQPLGTVTTNEGEFAFAADAPQDILFDGDTHTIEAILAEGVRPKMNSLTCGCSNPWVRSVSTNLQRGCNTKEYAGGFAVQVQEVCTVGDLSPLCYAISQEGELAQSAGFAILYKTAEHFVVDMLSSAQYSRYTMLEPQALPALGKRFSEQCAEHLDWLLSAQGLRRVANPCYPCKRTGNQSQTTRTY